MASQNIRNLPKEQRDAIRREQIVAAAIYCVACYGLHKATTAAIAKEAGFSEGQLYRYFPGKEAIIEAIAEHLTARQLERIIAAADGNAVAEVIAGDLLESSEARRKERILFLELHAEAVRNPVVATILRNSNRQIKSKAASSLRQEFPHLDEAEIAGFTEYFATASEGRIFREILDDKDATDKFLAIHKAVIAHLLSAPIPFQEKKTVSP